ncbi:MAG TPA: hypothetical protein VG498_19185 [Terriglobales bacterium]|nr:hypothetical protein [Terriglobales bacterium]
MSASKLTKFLATSSAVAVVLIADGDVPMFDLTTASSKLRGKASAG